MTTQATTITPMILTGEALTNMIRGGVDVADLTTLTPEEYEAVRDGLACLQGDSKQSFNLVYASGPLRATDARHDAARAAYIEALETHLDAVMIGCPVEDPSSFRALWLEYTTTRNAMKSTSPHEE